VNVEFKSNSKKWSETYDYVLVSVGRVPNSSSLGLDKCDIEIDDKSFIIVNEKLQTKASNIYAIGDVIGQPMLAHKAAKEGKLAAEIISNQYDIIDYKTIPSVAYTSPEVAWMGLTENFANQNSIDYEKASFPWAASGRAQASNSTNGLTKILYDKKTKKILGAGIAGENAGELISESVLGFEMGANIEDVALTVHPHPTLSETTFFASEIADGTITDLYMPKK
jgi:dihydrolipoamide dehydrogenase